MAPYPMTHISVGSSYAVIAAGPWLHVLDTKSGEVLAQEDTGLPVRVLAVDDSFHHVATTGDDKKLVIRQRESLSILSSRELPKRATAIAFVDKNTLVVADKFGDVFHYPIHPPVSTEPDPNPNPNPSDTDNDTDVSPSDTSLLLGHVSIVTALQLSHDRKHILTADRDEHIRVSRFPQGFVIERFLFGHRRYVTALHIPPFAPERLISGGGEPQLFVWNWTSGQLLQTLGYESQARQYMCVKPWRKRGKAFADASKKGKLAREEDTGVDGDVEDEGKKEGLEEVQGPEDTEIVFAVGKISTLGTEEGGMVLFFLIGCSALFYVPFPSPSLPDPQVQALPVGKPVLDFRVSGHAVWVSVDEGWPENEGKDAGGVKLVVWEGGFVEQAEHPLLRGINSCSHHATPDQLNTLESYQPLLLLPKYGEEASPDEDWGPKDRPGAKSEGRKKTREMLLAAQGGGKKRKAS
ncbi:WD40 repeat-like protein [Dacryopinax primogenitus]|uniref:WD40 repeat-like protein n=1 Tax=Dacryopinax primogenitus (strain DJM 731) TaxID=1858805 RepID=M5G4Y0_DACPD|nr:WD40 repeat-like protein [Dacryopinax primogenitus]EJU03704.1 WD40 repeat-like protein [Dacryopinax primogenitus]